jgi:acylphosphatase
VAAAERVTAERLTARLTGRVQGVGFRYWVRRQADSLGVTGWVMNANDERTVEVVAEGEPEALSEMEQRIRRGPPGAIVESVEVRRGPATSEFDGFGIMRP